MTLMKLPRKATLFFLTITIMIVTDGGATGKMTADRRDLPKTVGAWTRSETTRLIDSANIFGYMNGAGELYLGYRFNHLEVFNYTADGQPKILVELYYMKTPDDAFGLLSLDWGG